LRYSLLPKPLAVCRALPGTVIPAWALAAEFSSVVHTRDEISIVCAENLVDRAHADLVVEPGWIDLKLEGPFPFAISGVLASFIQPLADAVVPIFALSTFDTDYVLIKREHQKTALQVLAAAGHEMIDG
jgi:uncharacterized protein